MKLQSYEEFLNESAASNSLYDVMTNMKPMFSHHTAEITKYLKTHPLSSEYLEKLSIQAIKLFRKSGYYYSGITSGYIKDAVDAAGRLLNNVKKLMSFENYMGKDLEIPANFEAAVQSAKTAKAAALVIGALLANLENCKNAAMLGPGLEPENETERKRDEAETLRAIEILKATGLLEEVLKSELKVLDSIDKEMRERMVKHLRQYFPEEMHTRRGKDSGHKYNF